MKRLIILCVLLCSFTALSAQNYIVINSEKVFKSIPAYTQAMKDLDTLAEQYQTEVKRKFAEVENFYNQYQAHKSELSKTKIQEYEQAILIKEREAQEFQENVFGKEGVLMKRRLELIQPIQKRVFGAIELYAVRAGADMVLDSSNNPTLLYNSAKVDHTDRLIEFLKK